jgi:hypothetical protein
LNRPYIPQPTAWVSDPIGSRALKLAGFCLFMSGVYGLNLLLEIMVR